MDSSSGGHSIGNTKHPVRLGWGWHERRYRKHEPDRCQLAIKLQPMRKRILLIALALFCIYRIAVKILSLFNLKLNRPDIMVDDVVTDVRESCDKTKLKSSKKRSFKLFLTPAEKVRREFKRTAKEKVYRICKSGDPGQLSYKSAGECASAVKRSEIAEIYDRARYSDYEITEKDAEDMKKICTEVVES